MHNHKGPFADMNQRSNDIIGELFECSLWFNSSKSKMENKLRNSKSNSGVGMNIGVQKKYFHRTVQRVLLYFDDGTKGEAQVKKNSWDTCTHLINECIGKWARQNGLWKQKLKKSRIPIFLRVRKSFNEFEVLTKV